MPNNLLRNIYPLAAPLANAMTYKRAQWKNGKRCCISLSFDVELTEDTNALPRLMRMLDKAGVKASFACIGMLVEKQPDKYGAVIDAGHEIFSHSYSHPDNPETNPDHFFNQLSYEELKAEVTGFDRVAKKLLNVVPVGFRTPHYGVLHTPLVYRALREAAHYQYSSSISSWTHRNALPHVVDGVLELPTTTCPRHFLSVLDSWHSVASPAAAHRRDFGETLLSSLDLVERNRTYACYYFDPRSIVDEPGFSRFLESLPKRDAWIATCREAARWWKKEKVST